MTTRMPLRAAGAALAVAFGLSLAPLASAATRDAAVPPVAAEAGTVAPAVAPGDRPNLLFVSFDTLRRDHVSCYGHEVLTTPRVDRLAKEGLRFTDAQGVVPITGPSHATMMTGLYPQEHGAFRNGVKLPASALTLAEILRAEGWATAAAVSGWTLRDAQCGLGQGFDRYDDAGMDERYAVVNLMRRADAVTDAALAWFDSRGQAASQPWFMFVHYFDPHEPYDLPGTSVLPPNPAKLDLPAAPLTEKLHEYDREIAFADREMGRLLDELTRRGLMSNTLVVFTADHGQSFGDNGYGDAEGAHGRKVYQTQVAVPLVLWMPGRVRAGATSDLPVSHVDLLPTIAELLRVPTKSVPAALPGASLARVAQDAEAPPPWGRARRTRHGLAFRGAVGNKWNIFRWAQNKDVEQAEPLCAYVLTDDGRKVIVDFANKKKVEVYDLKKDPGETNNLAGQSVPADEARERGEQVFAWYERTRAADLSTTAPSADDLEKLKSLGYVE